MKILISEIFQLEDGSRYHRYSLDGVRDGSGPPDIITNIFSQTIKQGGEIMVIDDIYCGLNFQGGAGGEAMVLEFNVFPGSPTAAVLTDPDHKPNYHESIPIGFNQYGPPEPARWTQFPYGYAKVGQTLQLCLRDSNSTSTAIKPFTVQFRERLVKASV